MASLGGKFGERGENIAQRLFFALAEEPLGRLDESALYNGSTTLCKIDTSMSESLLMPQGGLPVSRSGVGSWGASDRSICAAWAYSYTAGSDDGTCTTAAV